MKRKRGWRSKVFHTINCYTICWGNYSIYSSALDLALSRYCTLQDFAGLWLVNFSWQAGICNWEAKGPPYCWKTRLHTVQTSARNFLYNIQALRETWNLDKWGDSIFWNFCLSRNWKVSLIHMYKQSYVHGNIFISIYWLCSHLWTLFIGNGLWWCLSATTLFLRDKLSRELLMCTLYHISLVFVQVIMS